MENKSLSPHQHVFSNFMLLLSC